MVDDISLVVRFGCALGACQCRGKEAGDFEYIVLFYTCLEKYYSANAVCDFVK